MKPYESFFKNKKITVMGLGLLGRGVGDVRFLARAGAELIVTDIKTEEQLVSSLAELNEFSNITYHLGGHMLEDFQNRDMILKAAGVPSDSPYVAEAKKNHIPVRMSADLFVELSGVPTIGVTGTRGKSTTSHLLAHILKTAGREVFLGGNIRGVSTLAHLAEVTPDTTAVLELDSWQLQGFGEIKKSPNIAIFTTFMPDHMNYYKNDMAAYFADKANIFLYQEEDDQLILGEQMASCIEEYGYKNKVRAHVTVTGASLVPKSWKLKIPGEHNKMDIGIALAAARAFGIDDGDIQRAVESFEGVPGRLQFLREVRGIKIYNDTTATVPDATVAALRALGDEGKKNVLLIMGGADKNLDMTELLAEIPHYAKEVFLLAGTGTERIRTELPGAQIFESMQAAVIAALNKGEAGDVLLMSPAFASFGMFRIEFDRGDQFSAIVASLAE
jgi:UDP-N-acetylmuramoylalanine--D-glutamate ligase